MINEDAGQTVLFFSFHFFSQLFLKRKGFYAFNPKEGCPNYFKI